MRRLFALPLAALLLAGCAQSNAGGTGAGPAPHDPIALFDVWRVDAPSAGEDTWLRFDAHEFQLWHECSVVHASWRVSGPLLVAQPGAVVPGPECQLPPGPPEVPWLQSVRSFEVVEVDLVELQDASGELVATLTIDGAPSPLGEHDQGLVEPPEITDEVRAMFGEVADLPDGVEPATDIAGRWVPVSSEGDTEPFAEFESDGTWTGSDGCNGNGGVWASNDRGNFVATTGPSTLIFCEGAPVPAWLGQAYLAGLDAGELVLLDAQGEELGRLTPA